jgi:hypothetical protein
MSEGPATVNSSRKPCRSPAPGEGVVSLATPTRPEARRECDWDDTVDGRPPAPAFFTSPKSRILTKSGLRVDGARELPALALRAVRRRQLHCEHLRARRLDRAAPVSLRPSLHCAPVFIAPQSSLRPSFHCAPVRGPRSPAHWPCQLRATSVVRPRPVAM